MGGLLLVGCDDNVEVIRDPDIRISKGMTWAWRPANMPEETKRGSDGRAIVSRDVIKPEAPPPTQRLESNRDWNTEANRTQLQQAIQQALAKKGLTLVRSCGRQPSGRLSRRSQNSYRHRRHRLWGIPRLWMGRLRLGLGPARSLVSKCPPS